MAIHHIFPDGKILLPQLSVDLSALSSEEAMAALDRADDHAFDIWKDFCAQVSEARERIQNTGSIFGNARAFALSSGDDNPTVCRACFGSGGVNIFNADTGDNVWNACSTCGGTRHAGPVIIPSY